MKGIIQHNKNLGYGRGFNIGLSRVKTKYVLAINPDARFSILDLKLRLGEGSGAAIATLILKAALATHNGMATFKDAKVNNEIKL